MKTQYVLAPLLIVAVAACAPAGSQPSPELAALAGGWEKGLNSGDAEAIAALYSEDARVMPPNAEMGRGRDAARADFGPMIEGGLKGKLETIEAVVSGDIGYRVGQYVLTAPDGSLVDRGKFLEIWKKVGDEWQMSNDIWNSDLPPPPPAGSTLVFTHEVKDADHWIAAWTGENSRRDMFAAHGVTAAKIFQNPDKPNMTAVQLQIDDMEAFQAYMNSDVIADAKAEDGVKDKTLRAFVEVK